jgi:Uma2 family endonuclease
MREDEENSLVPAWLIGPKTGQVEIYRGDRPLETLKNSATLSGESVLPDFELDLSKIWQSD